MRVWKELLNKSNKMNMSFITINWIHWMDGVCVCMPENVLYSFCLPMSLSLYLCPYIYLLSFTISCACTYTIPPYCHRFRPFHSRPSTLGLSCASVHITWNSPVRNHFPQRWALLDNGHHIRFLHREQSNFRQFTYRALGEFIVNDFVECCCITMESETL